MNRVFAIKLQELWMELLKRDILGKVSAIVWTIEFQKRGLPHAHMLLIMDPASRPTTVDDINAAVTAELLDPHLEPQLSHCVGRFILHNPCGPGYPKASCMRNGSCRWRYIKDWSEETILQENSRPVLKRPNNGRTYEKNGDIYDNRSVAPYNRYLLLRFYAHINVQLT